MCIQNETAEIYEESKLFLWYQPFFNHLSVGAKM